MSTSMCVFSEIETKPDDTTLRRRLGRKTSIMIRFHSFAAPPALQMNFLPMTGLKHL